MTRAGVRSLQMWSLVGLGLATFGGGCQSEVVSSNPPETPASPAASPSPPSGKVKRDNRAGLIRAIRALSEGTLRVQDLLDELDAPPLRPSDEGLRWKGPWGELLVTIDTEDTNLVLGFILDVARDRSIASSAFEVLGRPRTFPRAKLSSKLYLVEGPAEAVEVRVYERMEDTPSVAQIRVYPR